MLLHCRAQKQAIDLESEIEAMEAEMERLSAESAEAAAARAALKAVQAEASELREQVRRGAGGFEGVHSFVIHARGIGVFM